jgi:hypothetical protein
MTNPEKDGIRLLAPRNDYVWSTLALLAIALATGCSRHYEDRFSRARPPVFKATGRVTWNGEPAPGATVSLQSQSHNLAATSITDAQGKFVLTTWRYADGAVAGDHKVTVETLVPTNPAAPAVEYKNVMPPKYQDPETSGLTAVISDTGPNVLSFEVVGPRREVRQSGSTVTSE